MSGPSPDLTATSHEGSAPVRGGVRVWSPMRRSPQASTRGVLQASTPRPPRTSNTPASPDAGDTAFRGDTTKAHATQVRILHRGDRATLAHEPRPPSASSWTPSGPPWRPRSPATPKPCRSSTWRTRCRTTARSPRTTPPSRNRTAGSTRIHRPANRSNNSVDPMETNRGFTKPITSTTGSCQRRDNPPHAIRACRRHTPTRRRTRAQSAADAWKT